MYTTMNRTQINSLLQHELLCCRVCLMLDCRLYNIHEYKLADTFTRISGTPVSRDGLPQYLCAYCLMLLLKCSSFSDMCVRTLKQLTPTLRKGALDTDYIRKYQLPHRSLNLTQTEIKTIDLLPEDLHNEHDEHILSIDGINEAYPEMKPEILEDINEIGDDFEYEIVLKDGIFNKRKIDNIKAIKNTFKTKKTRKRDTVKQNMALKIERVFNESMDIDKNLMKTEATETPVKKNMVLKIEPFCNKSMDFDNHLMKIEKENTVMTAFPVKENMVLKVGSVYNQSMDFDNNLMKMKKENAETPKMMMIEVKDDKIELKVGEKSGNNDNIYYEVHEKIEDVKMKRKKVPNVTRTECKKNVMKSGNNKRKRPRFIPATFESTYDLEIVTLSKEEQLEEIATRKKSESYLMSHFKCEDCGKGFGVESAYNNHRARHSPSNGPYSCEICTSYYTRHSLYIHQKRHQLKYICNACNFVSRHKGQAIKHHATHTGKTYECPHCLKTFIRSTSCLNHLRLAHPERNLDCVDCGETFVGDHGLRQHRRRIHDVKLQKFICTICSAEFNSVSALNTHTDTAGEHTDLRPCEQCGENCASEDALQEHVEEMHPTESHHCEVCNVAFSNAAALITHSRRKHLGRPYALAPRLREYKKSLNKPKPCMCEQCGAIVSPTNFAYHMSSHLAVKPYACPHCPKTFGWPHNLTNHVRTHSSDKPHQCPECPRAFNSKSNLKRHHNTAHLGIRGSFPCPMCGRTSTTKHSLEVHLRGVHGDAGWPKRDRSKRKKKTQLDD
ncbi:zinc finger protein 267-like [Cydia strobilella]|uniref:zinc finger protein 267-like n=1 Tax=Cydia strobilella TaxID=1100964 RepID=UPI003005B97E